MNDSKTRTTHFSVGRWTVHPQLGHLRDDMRIVALEPRLMQLLVYFSRHPGDVLSKDRLLEAIWDETFVAEATLTNAISELRRALGDDARSPSYIHTHAKLGYRLVAPVNGAIADSKKMSVTSPPKIALTPFTSYGASEVCAGLLTEAIATGLARSELVEAVSMLSVCSALRQEPTLERLAGSLTAQMVLEGSVAKAENCLWFSARLFDGGETCLWGELREIKGEIPHIIRLAAAAVVEEIERSIRSIEHRPNLVAHTA